MNETMTYDEEKNILEHGLLHRLMVLFNRPAAWPGWGVVLVGLLLSVLVGLAWQLLDAPMPSVWMVIAVQFCFIVADLCLFWLLPRRRISFGPWKAQTIVLAVPRSIGALLMVVVALWLGWWDALLTNVAGQLAGTLLLLWAAFVEPRRLHMTELEIEVPDLPPGAKPIRLLHITDIHVERLTSREEALIKLVDGVQADAVVVTGDYLNLSYNEDETAQAQVRDLLCQLHAPHGVYATLGSPPVDLRHEVVPLFEGLPVRLMRNEWKVVDFGDGRQVVLLGLDCTHFLDRDAACLESVVASAPNGVPRVLLYHSPELMPQAAPLGVDLYLCGHTHGGQVRLPLLGPILTSSQLGRRYVMGHYQEGRTHLYVSRGVGLEGLSAPRVRLLAPPEITLVTLRPSQNGSAPGEQAPFSSSDP